MKYYQSNTRMYPVEVREDGSIMLHHAQTGEPLKQQTANMIRTFGSVDALLKSCKESPAHDLNEFSKWASKVESAKGRKMKAEAMLNAAEYELKKLQHRVKNYSYAETKAMGCIAQVDWDGETLENPKTGNEFFTPEDAKATYESLYEQDREEIEKQRKEWWGGPKDYPISFDDYFRMNHEVCEDASDFLDDLVEEEREDGTDVDERDYWNERQNIDFWLRQSPEFEKFHSRKKGNFLLAVLNYYLEGSGNPYVEHFSIKASGLFNGKHKEYTITGDDKGGFKVVNDNKRSVGKNPLLKQYIEFYLDGCSGDEIRRIAEGDTSEELLKDFKPGARDYELGIRYLRLAARYVVRNYKLETFG